MKHRLFNAATLVSLVLCLAGGVLWVRSYWVTDSWERIQHPKSPVFDGFIRMSPHVELRSASGTLVLFWTDPFPAPDAACEWRTYPGSVGWRASLAYLWTFDRRTDPARVGVTRHALQFPQWMPVGFFALLPMAWSVKHVRRARKANACPSCGYDLRGSLSGGSGGGGGSGCPECGAVSGARDSEA